jgi:hypothetical protein
MDRKQIEAEHIVARYLADQLSPAQAAEFEAYYTQHPSMVREIEYALRLKEGLAALRDRGQLDALMRARRGRWAMPLSIAAAIAVAIIGGWTWYGSPQSAPVASTLDGLVPGMSTPMPLGGKYLLVRMRSANDGTLQIPLPAARSALELQMLPSAGFTGAPYQVALTRMDADGKPSRVGEAQDLTPGPDGLVSAWLDSARLQPGRHTVELIPANAGPTSPVDRFVIDLR